MRKVALATACLTVAIVGCSEKKASPPQTTGTPAPATSSAPSESPSPTPLTAAFTVGAVFYGDTFADTSKGWKTAETARAQYRINTDYAVKSLTITAKAGDTQLFPHPEFRGISREQLRDYQVTAKIQSTLSIGQEDWMGVTCRDLNNKRYSFQIRNDLTTRSVAWRIAKHDGSNIDTVAEGGTDIGGSAWDVSGACFTASDGSAQLVMSVNDEEVGRYADTTSPLAEGYGGVYLLARNSKATINVLGFSVRSVTAT